MLKTTMETLPHLATALEKANSFALSKAREVCRRGGEKIGHWALDVELQTCMMFLILCTSLQCLQDPRSELIKERILQTINEDVKAPKGGKTANFQRCFAIKSGISDLMDVARKTYCELINDIHGNFSSYLLEIVFLNTFELNLFVKQDVCLIPPKDHVIDLGSNHSLPVKMNYSATKGYHIQIPIQKSHPIKKSDLPSLFVQVNVTE